MPFSSGTFSEKGRNNSGIQRRIVEKMYENILDSGYQIFSKDKYIFRGDICDMRRLWGLVGGLARPLRLALLLLLSGQPLTGLLIWIRWVVMMGINAVLILLLFLSKVVTINIFL